MQVKEQKTLQAGFKTLGFFGMDFSYNSEICSMETWDVFPWYHKAIMKE